MLQFYPYWINVSAHTKSTIGKVCFVLKRLSLITFLTMGISSDYGREARCSSFDQGKDRREDRLDKDWTRKASSSDRLAGFRYILQNTSWQDVAVSHLHVSCIFACNVAWLRCTFLCNVV